MKLALLTLSVAAVPVCVSSCDEPRPTALEKVVIAGRTFNLEPVTDDEHRFKGLSSRTEIKADGGMIFAFKEPRDQNFVMRDCPVPIDIIYLDGAGRVTASHKMTVEKPRADDEKENKPRCPSCGKAHAPACARADGAKEKTPPQWTWTNDKYEARLKQYPSRFPAQYAIELKGDTLDTLKVKQGDKVEFDIAGLKKRAK